MIYFNLAPSMSLKEKFIEWGREASSVERLKMEKSKSQVSKDGGGSGESLCNRVKIGDAKSGVLKLI